MFRSFAAVFGLLFPNTTHADRDSSSTEVIFLIYETYLKCLSIEIPKTYTGGL